MITIIILLQRYKTSPNDIEQKALGNRNEEDGSFSKSESQDLLINPEESKIEIDKIKIN